MVDRAPAVEKVIRDLLDFIGGMQVVAHNASFDQRFLDSECSHLRQLVTYKSFVCSMRVSRRVYPTFASHALGALAEQLGVSYRGSAHRALADAEVTANVMTRIGRDLGVRHKNLQIDARLLHQVMKMPVAKAAAKLQRLSLARI
jgi:DNA polymerase-3 subunit epsilon